MLGVPRTALEGSWLGLGSGGRGVALGAGDTARQDLVS